MKLRIKSRKYGKPEVRDISFSELFRFATVYDYMLLLLAVFMTLLKALVHPIAIIVYSELVAMFVDRNTGIGSSSKTYALPLFGGGKLLTNATHEENMAELKNDSIAFGILIALDSLLLFLSGIANVDIFNRVALHQVLRMRRKFFEATVRQDMSWHDMVQNQNFAVHITDNMEKIRNGISENIGHFLQLIMDIFICVVISFAYGWKLTSAVCIYIPITILINYAVVKYQSTLTAKEQNSYASASSVAEESIGAIRTVVAFGGEQHEWQRYDERLEPARKAGKLKGAFSGLNDSVLKSMLFISSAAVFWYGVHLVLDDRNKEANEKEYTPAVLSIVVTGVIVSADHIARTAPFLEAFALARGSAAAIFDVIDSKSKIDPMSTDGKIVNYGLKGNIVFQDVFFSYPSRMDAVVLRGIHFRIDEGKTVALVGTSGSGKSTCVQLLQRFYDPSFGKITLDGVDIRQYNVSWLRSNMAVVGQQPVLFQGTIGQNIRYGNRNATQKDVETASRSAGAHDFIIGLPLGYDTIISEQGTQLSGGQRQRIAIARALIQNPKILLLDEATSALDYHSEKLVQEALDHASKGRTTLVVSHRLSAVRQADHIIFMDNGKVVEQGSHNDLMGLEGKYYKMVKAHAYSGTYEEVLELSEPNFGSTMKKSSGNIDIENNEDNTSIDLDKTLTLKNQHNDSKLEEYVKEEQKDTKHVRTFIRILGSARPEWGYLILGTICAAIYGGAQPAFSLVSAEFYAAMALPIAEEVLQHTAVVSIASVVTGITAGVLCYTQTYFLNLAGVWLTTRMRSKVFSRIMQQEMAWFDEKDNSVGALSARLSGDAASVQGAIGFPLSNIVQAITNFICGFSISFYYSWELALICLCTAPVMVASILFEARFSSKAAVHEKEVVEETSRIATETITHIRTVASLRREPALIEEYDCEIERYSVEIRKRLRFRGLVSSLGMAIMFFGYAVTLCYGGIMCAEGRINFQDIIKVASTLLYGLFLLAQSLTFTPAFNAALVAGHRLYQIIDREPRIKSAPHSSASMQNGIDETSSLKENVMHDVCFRDVYFRYPTRPQQNVLHSLNLKVMQGKTVALVGSSGCGKSTCIQLLQRFYDPCAGRISVDQRDIQREFELPDLRRRFGIVSQEPTLFDKTIAENIAFGDTERTISMSEIIEASKMANAHDFITALPSGYDTNLGTKGTQLSGGQKQRIAIARALVRKPQILLLDEATSALDVQSEKLVQSALDVACSGRTCIIIAHRLATVQNADIICVLQKGRIVEQGSHPQLLAMNGIYAKLYRSQPDTQ